MKCGTSESIFSTLINNTINEEQIFGLFSLLNDFQGLLKLLPQNFEISTNNGKYKFNKNMAEMLFLDINKDLKEYHFDINDEQNVMQKIENLFKGELVEFIKPEENTIKEIIPFLKKGCFPKRLLSRELPDKIAFKINPNNFIKNFSRRSYEFQIKTNQKNYDCNFFGILSSKTILAYLQSNPTSTEFFYDYNDKNDALMLIINFFNFEKITIDLKEAYSILPISEQLGITSLIDPLKSFIKEMEEKEDHFEEFQKIIDPYDELFENLHTIKKIGIEKVADFIEKSEWETKNRNHYTFN